MPGDPVDAYLGMGSKATPEQKQQIREELGLDKSLPEQYVIWVGNLAKGELGTSTKFKLPVSEIIGDYVWNTFLLNLVSLVIGIGLSIPIGIKQATKKFSKFDNFWTVFSLLGVSVPTFFFALILIFLRSAAFRRDTGQRYAYPRILQSSDMIIYSRKSEMLHCICCCRQLYLRSVTLRPSPVMYEAP